MVKDVKTRYVLHPVVGDQLDTRLPYRAFTTLTTRINTLKSEVDHIRGMQDFIGASKISGAE